MRRVCEFGLLVASLLGCGDTLTATQIMVVIDAESGVRSQTQRLQVAVRGFAARRGEDDREALDRTLGASEFEWPHLVALTPLDGDADRLYEVTATALDAEDDVVAQVRAISGYRKNELLALELLLEDSCIGITTCGAEETCKGGECVPADVDVDSLKLYDPNGVGAPSGVSRADAGVVQPSGGTGGFDGGTTVAIEDGGPADARAPDAAADGGGGGSNGEDGGSDAALAECPTSLPGPALVQVPAPPESSIGSYCIDATEVTNAQYAAFLGASPATSGQPAECAWNTSYVPLAGWPATGRDEYPVVFVDWCDARAYCAWAGKRLCGKIGGGASAFGNWNATASEWYNTCSAGGTLVYPYGDSYMGAACVGLDYDGTSGYQSGTDVAQPVGSAAGCHGVSAPFDAIFDLSGNVHEWEDSCDGATGAANNCHVRGGSFGMGASSSLECGYNFLARDFQSASGGFRCCSD